MRREDAAAADSHYQDHRWYVIQQGGMNRFCSAPEHGGGRRRRCGVHGGVGQRRWAAMGEVHGGAAAMAACRNRLIRTIEIRLRKDVGLMRAPWDSPHNPHLWVL